MFLSSELLFVLQGFGTATGSMKTTGRTLPPYLKLVLPPTSRFTCKFKRPGWPSVSLITMLFIFFEPPSCSPSQCGDTFFYLSACWLISISQGVRLSQTWQCFTEAAFTQENTSTEEMRGIK